MLFRSDGEEDKAAAPKGQKHRIKLAFRPPDWKIHEIASIKASLDLTYFGGSQLLKLSNAIPAKWIIEPKAGGRMSWDSSEKLIQDPKLDELGLALQLQSGMIQSGMTMLTFSTTAKEATITEVQVFDASGRPWPTMIQNRGQGENMCQVMVYGRPAAPLSLAMLVSSGGTSVSLPIKLEHVPVTGK